MDRRSFFRTMVGGVATAAAVRTWPFRVYSFPSEPVRANSLYGIAYYRDVPATHWVGLNRIGRIDVIDPGYWGALNLKNEIAYLKFKGEPAWHKHS